MIFVTADIMLEDAELQFTAMRASGPGGQHVNTTNSAVQLKFDAANSPAIKSSVLFRLRKIAGQRMTREGIIILQASDERSQHRNRAIIQERLLALIRAALIPPKPRRKTRPTKGSVKRRLAGKSYKSNLKKMRGRPKNDD